MQRIFYFLIYVLDRIAPKQHKILIHTFPDGDDQGVSVCKAVARVGASCAVIWLVDDIDRDWNKWLVDRGVQSSRIRFQKKRSLGGLYQYLTAEIVLITHGLFGSFSPARGKLVVYIGHGMPIKVIWKGKAGSKPPNVTKLLATSPFFAEVMCRAGGYKTEQFLNIGLPRNDLLLSPSIAAKTFVDKVKRTRDAVILYLPTYRRSKIGFVTADGEESSSALGMDFTQKEKLASWLKERNICMLVKPHPMSIHAGNLTETFGPEFSTITESDLWSNHVGLYEILSNVDLLITDVSSIYIDNLVSSTPTILYFPDQSKYEATRGLLLEPLSEYATVPLAGTFEELIATLSAWRSGSKIESPSAKALRKLMNPRRRFSSAELLLNACGIATPIAEQQIPRTPNREKIALFWAQYGPYHYSRASSLAAIAPHLDIVPAELGSVSLTYNWERNEKLGLVNTMFKGRDADSLSSLRIYMRVYKFLKRNDISIVFVPSYWPKSALAILLAAKASGAQVVMMNESHAGTAVARGLALAIKKFIVRLSDAALVGGSPQREYFEKLGIPKDRIFDGYDIVENDFFQVRAEAFRADDNIRKRYRLPARYLLSVGRLEAKKNLSRVIEAYASVRKTGATNFRLVIVGSGSLEEKLKRQIVDLGLSFADFSGISFNGEASEVDVDVYFYGFRQIEELPVFYAYATGFVLASTVEEWGLVVNEALASGTPVLVSKTCGSAPDLVVDGVSGFQFDPGNLGELALNIARLKDLSPNELSAMRERCISYMRKWGPERFGRSAVAAIERATRRD